MTKFFFYSSIIIAVLLSSCSDNDSDNLPSVNAPTQDIDKDFINRFPGVTEVSWSVKDEYNIAKFKVNYKTLISRSSNPDLQDAEAWYLSSGSCELIDVDLPKGGVKAIEDAWKISDLYKAGFTILVNVELITRDNKKYLYKLEVASEDIPDEEGYDLFYSLDAKLLSYMPDTNIPNSTRNDNLPTPSVYQKHITDNYPDGMVLNVYRDEDTSLGQTCDICVFSQNKAYYMIFNDVTKEFYEEYSFWTLNEVPQVIKDAILNIDSSATDGNTEIERVKKAKELYYIINTHTESFTLNEKGEKI